MITWQLFLLSSLFFTIENDIGFFRQHFIKRVLFPLVPKKLAMREKIPNIFTTWITNDTKFGSFLFLYLVRFFRSFLCLLLKVIQVINFVHLQSCNKTKGNCEFNIQEINISFCNCYWKINLITICLEWNAI